MFLILFILQFLTEKMIIPAEVVSVAIIQCDIFEDALVSDRRTEGMDFRSGVLNI